MAQIRDAFAANQQARDSSPMLTASSRSLNEQVPTRASMRRLLAQLFPCDASLMAFLIDHYPIFAARLNSGMDRLVKVNLVLSTIQINDLLSALQNVFPVEVSRYAHMLSPAGQQEQKFESEPTKGSATHTTVLVRAADGTKLSCNLYSPSPTCGKVRNNDRIIVILHGYGEHRGYYHWLASNLSRQGYTVLVGDFRGHGMAEGMRAYVNGFDEYLLDIDALIQYVNNRSLRKNPGVILLGHSMGGLLAVQYVRSRPRVVDALILSSPLFSLKIRLPTWKRLLALIASKLLPELALPMNISPRDLSHRSEFVRAYSHDPLIGKHATSRWYASLLAAQASVSCESPCLELPCLLLQAGEDRVVDNKFNESIYQRIVAHQKEVVIYNGFFHSLFNEVGRRRVLADMLAWLARNCELPSS